MNLEPVLLGGERGQNSENGGDRFSNGNLANIEIAREKLLRDGFSTNFGGGFLLIPYYLQIGLAERVKALGLEDKEGIPILSAILGLINVDIFETGTVQGIKDLKDKGFPALCGLGKIPDTSFFYRFLEGVKTRGAEDFMVDCSRKFVETGLNEGRIVNLDGRHLAYYGKKKIGKAKHATRNIVLPALNVFVVQDQETRNPIFLTVQYPGLSPMDVAIPLLEKTMEIAGGSLEKVIWDRWFSVGALLNYLDKHLKLKYVTIMRLHRNRIQEMKDIPVSEFRTMADGRQVAFKATTLRNYEDKARLIAVRFEEEDEEEKYYGYLTNDYDSTEEATIEEYDHRWRIENLFKEADFTGFDKVPSTDLNQATMSFATKLVAFNIMSSLRRDIGGEFASRELKGILKEFLRVQAFVQALGRAVHVTFYGHQHENILRPLFAGLNEKLMKKGIDGRVPWLGYRTLEFHFL